jgi:SAM-dependent methyltransferase
MTDRILTLSKGHSHPSNCDICGSIDYRLCFTTKDRLQLTREIFQIVECAGCGVLRTLPEIDEVELSRFYPNDYWGAEPSLDWIRKSQADKTDFLKECQLTSGRILDIGCGAGFFLRALDAKRWDCFGVEISRDAATAAANAIGEERIFPGTIIDARLPAQSFDTVTFWSALEHTTHPQAQLIEAHRILKTGGTLIVQVPNSASYQARYFKGDWFALDAPRHRYHFNLETLTGVLQGTGFQPKYSTFNSAVHNAHALRQSLKTKLWGSPIKRPIFLLSLPFLKPFDRLLSSKNRGATLTVAAQAR